MTNTNHAIFTAHLDSVWMWPWTAGLDEALATSRSVCDRLDAHPEFFTRKAKLGCWRWWNVRIGLSSGGFRVTWQTGGGKS